MAEANIGWGFSVGDVIAKILGDKWVVTGYKLGCYSNGTPWYSYRVRGMNHDRSGELVFDKWDCENDCVKVGRWDFDLGCETEDDERD